MGKGKIAVAMSGGVDSTVTAALLKNEGYEVRGAFMSLAQPNIAGQIEKVKGVAADIGVAVDVIDLHREFSAKVLDYFRNSYFKGLTPNPCVVCNRHIKFGLLLEKVLGMGNDFMATGHYVRVRHDGDGKYHLLKGLDPAKDQSYFLCLLDQQPLSRIKFPLGGKTKDEVYRIAENLGLKFDRNEESQDVCFLQGTSVGDFIEKGNEDVSPGKVVTLDGREVGEHCGVHRFTVGQRRGLGIPDASPYYVIALDAESNRVVVGRNDDLFCSEVKVLNVNWLAGSTPESPLDLQVRIRYRHKESPAEVDIEGQDVAVRFAEPQRAVTPGQFAVFYDGDEVLGGGVISR